MSDSPKFLLDENVPALIKKFLESRGFHAEYVPKGIVDSKAISLAKKRRAVFVSRDSDFANTSMFPPMEFSGIIVFAIHPPIPENLVRVLSSFLSKTKKYEGKLFIVGEGGFEAIE